MLAVGVPHTNSLRGLRAPCGLCIGTVGPRLNKRQRCTMWHGPTHSMPTIVVTHDALQAHCCGGTMVLRCRPWISICKMLSQALWSKPACMLQTTSLFLIHVINVQRPRAGHLVASIRVLGAAARGGQGLRRCGSCNGCGRVSGARAWPRCWCCCLDALLKSSCAPCNTALFKV